MPDIRTESRSLQFRVRPVIGLELVPLGAVLLPADDPDLPNPFLSDFVDCIPDAAEGGSDYFLIGQFILAGELHFGEVERRGITSSSRRLTTDRYSQAGKQV